MAFAIAAKLGVELDQAGRVRLTEFMNLPTRTELPEYYSTIKSPIDLKTIHRKIEGSKYSSLKDFHEDMQLLWQNAKEFNDPQSKVSVFSWPKLLSDSPIMY